MFNVDFRGKVVLITGASSGIGEALAREFARRGASVALCARRADRLERLAAELRTRPGTQLGNQQEAWRPMALPITCDVTKDGDLEKAVAITREQFGKLDIAVANAGFGVAGNFEGLGVEDYRRQFETNVFGVLRTAYAVKDELKKARGSLVIVGSIAGHIALPGGSPYCMSKFAVRALAYSLRYELKPHGISVTLISPGFVDSEFRKVDNLGQLRPEAADAAPAWLSMPAPRAARQIARAVWFRRKEAIITTHGKIAVFVNRHFPWMFSLASVIGLKARRPPSCAAS